MQSVESRPKEYNCNPTAPEAQGTRQSGGRDCKRQRPFLPQHQNKTFKGKDGGGDENTSQGGGGKLVSSLLALSRDCPVLPCLSFSREPPEPLVVPISSAPKIWGYRSFWDQGLRDGEWISWWSGLLRQFSMEWIWLLHSKIEHTRNINLIVFLHQGSKGDLEWKKFSF